MGINIISAVSQTLLPTFSHWSLSKPISGQDKMIRRILKVMTFREAK